MSDILTKIKSTADILGGTVFFANELGQDPEFEGAELLPNGMYIRLEGSDGSVAYVSAHEIDKAIGIIGQMSMSKANQSDVDAIIEMLDEKVSKTEIELLKTDIANKVDDDDFNDLSGKVATKAEKSEVENLSGKVATKAEKSEVISLQSSIDSKASLDEFNLLSENVNSKSAEIVRIKNDIAALQNAMSSVGDSNSIAALQNQINYLNSELNKKLEIDDLSGLKSSVSTLNEYDAELTERISNVETNISKKASTTYVQGQVNELNKAITGISARVDSKADKEIVAKKASKSDLDALTSKVTSLSNEFNDTKNEFENLNNNIYSTIADKVSSEKLDIEINKLETALEGKVEKTEYNSSLNRLSNSIETAETELLNKYNSLASDLDELKCETDNSVLELNSNLTYQHKQIELQNEQIKSLKNTDRNLEEQLKMQWVRVMTPEEYNSLAPINSSNPFAKKPNVIYMLVRYNKPIAIYIGDVLIAEAEKTGSTGFVYTFPIVF